MAIHDHVGGDGAAITESALSLSDVTTGDVSITKHGFAPKAPNDTAKFLRGDATWQVPPTGGGGLAQLTSLVASRPYPSPHILTYNISGLLLNANTIYYVPYFVPQSGAVAKISIIVTFAGSADARGRMGIYTNVAGLPSALVVDGGEFTPSSTGEFQLTISPSLSVGWYWLAIVINSPTTAPKFSSILSQIDVVGNSITGTTISSYKYINQSFTYGALPSTVGTLTWAQNPAPLMFLTW